MRYIRYFAHLCDMHCHFQSDPSETCANMAFFKFIFTLFMTFNLAYSSQFDRFQVEFDNYKYKLINVTENKSYICANSPVVPATESNQNTYIKSDLRFDLCQVSYQTVGKTFESDFSRLCFADGGHIATIINPCYLVCQEKSKLKNEPNSDDCDSSEQTKSTFLLTDFPCGHNHVCDSNGCCVETLHKSTDDISVFTNTPAPVTQTVNSETPDPVTPIPETSATPDPVTPIPETSGTPDPVTPIPETSATPDPVTPIPETSATTDPVTPIPETSATPDPVTPIPETSATPDPNSEIPDSVTDETITKRHCEYSGYFPDKRNPQHYYFCKFFATVYSCGDHEIFDATGRKCMLDPNIEDPALDLHKWNRAIRCTKEGTFISPYNCEYFYQCVSVGIGYNVYFFHCSDGLVFNESIQQCTYKTQRCNNALVIPDSHGHEV